MSRPHGKPSSSARGPRGADHVANAVASVGTLLSLGLIVTSAILNFRMGYRGADTEFDGLVYGIAVGMGDGLKALAPFVAAWGFRHRDYLATFAAVLVFTVFTTYSFTAALGFAAEHRSNKSAAALDKMEKHGDLRKEYGRNETRLDELGPQRTPQEVGQAITAALNKPVGKWTVAGVSANCTLNRISTRASCADIANLQQELARANEAKDLTDKQSALRKGLNAVAGGTAQSDDPQEDALQRVAKAATFDVDKKSIGSFLAFLLALFIEFGSGMGLYIATTPWRSLAKANVLVEEDKRSPPRWRGNRPAITLKAHRLGAVDAYALDRLEPAEGCEVAEADLYADYVVWCRWRGEAAFDRAEFVRAFAGLARAAGMAKGAGQRYRRVKLIGR